MDRIPLLVATAGPLKGERFQVNDIGLRLGRGKDCDVEISDNNVSREHAVVLLHNSAVWVKDAGSRNGVFVNSQRVVRPKQLSPGDELTVGDHTFTLELAPPLPVDSSSVSIVTHTKLIREGRSPRLAYAVVAVVLLLGLVMVLLSR